MTGLMLPHLPNIATALLLSGWLTHLDTTAPIYGTLVIFLTLYISWFRSAGILLFIGLCLDLFQRLYGGYAGKEIDSSDIYLFLTHLDDIRESAELAFVSGQGVLPGFFATCVLMMLGLYFRKYTKTALFYKVVVAGGLGILLLFDTAAGRLAVEGTGFVVAGRIIEKNKKIPETLTSCTPHETVWDVVVILGESMRYEKQFFEKLDGDVREIFSGGTNTDTSLPLLFNGAETVMQLREKSPKNLFYLAKQNGYRTYFISAQSAGNLKYIRPYLFSENIDYLKTYERDELGELYDEVLIQELSRIPSGQKKLVVLQMVGEHSPYTFYPKKYLPHATDADTAMRAKEDYYHAFRFSVDILQRIIKTVSAENKRPVTIVFTSDHGELLGEHFGHNQFKKSVYRVPFFVSGDPEGVQKTVRSHHDVYRLIREGLGWTCRDPDDQDGIVINGTMLSGEDGFLRIVTKKNGTFEGTREWF